ncbi:hypothetical protein HMPREF0970_01727 [Schaalia odontolytica F0309]|uniref:Uncharacterized protein n=2 Tax=Schaalia TaxID=2529408 RepID=D4U0I4_9ACTO|nr:hypothetical protein HMPREF0970_01727 [Schaalia odontolytica F0309]
MHEQRDSRLLRPKVRLRRLSSELPSPPTGRMGETGSTTTNVVESITMGYQDMRKARSRVDFGTGK